MNVEVKAVLDRMAEGVRGEADDDALLVPVADLRVIVAALSSPPVDDVREALANIIADAEGQPSFPRPKNFPPLDGDYRAADAVLAAFEVRPYGTVTDTEVERSCEIMHDAYEAAAASEGWETQEASRKPWVDVPEANKRTMRYAVRTLLEARS